MSRVLLVGLGPLPAPGRQRIYAPGVKLEIFLNALRRAGCQVLLAEIYFAGIEDAFEPMRGDGIIEHRLLGPKRDQLVPQLNAWVDECKPDAMIAFTDIGCLTAARCGFDGPLHCGYFGHPMAERQQQAAVHGSNASLHEQWLTVLPVLLRADRFSVESNAQRLALTGELGAAGRLNAETCGHELVEIIPPTLPFAEPLVAHDPEYLRKKGIPRGARVLFSSGGFNTWVDEETYFLGVEDALKKDPNLHFVTTGGAIEGHVEVVFQRFEKRIAKSPVRERFHLLGWVPHAELFDAMLGADVGINCDRSSLEGELGARNRLLGWVWAGMRVVSTVTSEPTERLVEQGWVHAIPEGDWQALSDAVRDEAALGRRTNLAPVHEELAVQWGREELFQGITQWALSPRRAPDRAEGRLPQNPLVELHSRFLARADDTIREARLLQTARQLADRLQGSRAIQLYGRLHPEAMALIAELKRLCEEHQAP